MFFEELKKEERRGVKKKFFFFVSFEQMKQQTIVLHAFIFEIEKQKILTEFDASFFFHKIFLVFYY